MVLYFITDSRFAQSNESIYNLNGSLGDSLWQRYLEHFEKIVVIARVKKNAPTNSTAPQTKDPRVSFIEIPYYLGVLGYLQQASKIKKIIRDNIVPGVAYICRVPSTLGNIAIDEIRKRNLKYAVEVVGDPKDSLSYTATHNIIPALLSYFTAYKLEKNVYNAEAALYVTNETLQKRYPIHNGGFSIGVSDVVINTNLSYEDIKPFPTDGVVKLLCVGSLEQMYKSPDIVLKALAKVLNNGVAAHLYWLGDGKFKNPMMALASSLRISDSVSFVGNVSKDQVNEYLRDSDIYIQASRTEGLPRALVEAMAVGLPCIGTRVGGIPELIEEEYLMTVDDINKLSEIISKLVSDKDYTLHAKQRNYFESLSFNPTELKKKRDMFFRVTKDLNSK